MEVGGRVFDNRVEPPVEFIVDLYKAGEQVMMQSR